MDQYPVPQFIEQEGKIAFFLSFSQFFYLVGAGVICFILFYILPFGLFIPLALIIVIGAVGLAFIKINGMPVAQVLLASVGFAVGGKNYVWKKQESPYPFKPIQRTRIERVDKGPVLQAHPSLVKRAKTAVEMKTR